MATTNTIIFGGPGNHLLQYATFCSKFLDAVHGITDEQGIWLPIFRNVVGAPLFLVREPYLPIDGANQAVNTFNHTMNERNDKRLAKQSADQAKLLAIFQTTMTDDKLRQLTSTYPDEDGYRDANIAEKFIRFVATFGTVTHDDVNVLIATLTTMAFIYRDNNSLMAYLTEYRTIIQFLMTKGIHVDPAIQLLQVSQAVSHGAHSRVFIQAIHDFNTAQPAIGPGRTLPALIVFLQRANQALTASNLQSAFAAQASTDAPPANPRKDKKPVVGPVTCTHPDHVNDPVRFNHPPEQCWKLHPHLNPRKPRPSA